MYTGWRKVPQRVLALKVKIPRHGQLGFLIDALKIYGHTHYTKLSLVCSHLKS